MAIVKKVDKKIKTTISDTTKYQILTHCFFNKIQISTADLDCLSLFAILILVIFVIFFIFKIGTI